MKTSRSLLGAGILAAGATGLLGHWLGRASAVGIPASKPLVYSGVLSDASGAPLAGSKNIQISLASADGAKKCSTDPVAKALVSGAFSVELPDACTALVRQVPDLWLEVFIDGASLGTSKLGAVPFAVEATSAASAAGQLQTTLEGLQAAVTSLQSAATSLQARVATVESKYLRTVDGVGIKRSDIAGISDSAAHWDACLSSGNTINCQVVASRYCGAAGYRAGVFIGELSGSAEHRLVYCTK